MRSVRTRLVGWLHRIADQIADDGVEHLSRNQVHPQARADGNLGDRGFDAGSAQGKVDDAVEVTAVQNEVGARQGYIDRLYNDPRYIAYCKGLAASNDYLIRHPNLPSQSGLRPDFASLNARSQGVEP